MKKPEDFSITEITYCFYKKMPNNNEIVMKEMREPGLRIILSGQMKIVFDDTEFSVKKGDIVLHRKGELYTMVTEKSGVEYIIVYFLCKPQNIIDIYFDEKRIFTPNQARRYTDFFKRLADVYFNSGFLSKPLLRALGQELLCNIILDSHYNLGSKKNNFAITAKNFIDEYFSSSLSAEDIAKAAGCSTSYLRKLFLKIYGETPSKHLNRVRVEHAKEMLSSRIYSIEETALACGFKNVYYFNKVFSQYTGVTPGKY